MGNCYSHIERDENPLKLGNEIVATSLFKTHEKIPIIEFSLLQNLVMTFKPISAMPHDR